MENGFAQAGVWHDPKGLGQLGRAAHEHSPEALRVAAEQFEAMFVAQMLASMRATVPDDGLLQGRNEGMYREMVDRQVALDIAGGRGFGLADAIERQLSVQTVAEADATAPVAAGEPQTTSPADPARFVEELAPHARSAASQLGVEPSVLVAQAALETGWGRHVIRGADGNSSFNVFNIKAGSDWQGARVARTTVEYRDGTAARERAAFRAYDSLDDAFADYVDLIRGERYAGARAAADDPAQYVHALADAGYATDPKYAEKILSLVDRPELGGIQLHQGNRAGADSGSGTDEVAGPGDNREGTRT